MEFCHHFPCFTRSLKSARKEVSNIRQIGRENSNKKSTIPTSQKASDIAILIAPKINQPVKKKSKGILVKKLPHNSSFSFLCPAAHIKNTKQQINRIAANIQATINSYLKLYSIILKFS